MSSLDEMALRNERIFLCIPLHYKIAFRPMFIINYYIVSRKQTNFGKVNCHKETRLL